MRVYIVYFGDEYEWDIDKIFAKEDAAKSYCDFQNKSRQYWDRLDYFEMEVYTDELIF